MSLINDALKRAKESQKDPATGTAHFMTAAASPRGMSWGLILAAAALLAAACFFIGLALAKRDSAAPAATTVVATPAKPAAMPATTVVAKTPTAAVTTLTKTETPTPPLVSNAVVEAMPPPQPKLQAVIYDPQNPSAIVNGKTVHPTDVLGDFRIRAILPSAVLIEYGDGSITKLNLGE